MISRSIIFTILIGFTSCSLSTNQNQTTPDYKISDLTLKEIPEAIMIKGELLQSKSWTDSNGENILVVTRKGPFNNSAGDAVSAELFAEQYVKKGNSYKLLWDVYDIESECKYDLWIGTLPNSTQISDLDNDGITETTLIYRSSCRSDISPSKLKLLIFENNTKMGLEGLMALSSEEAKINAGFEPNLSKVDTAGLNTFEKQLVTSGLYNNEDDFRGKPQVFLEHAKKMWIKFVKEDDFVQL